MKKQLLIIAISLGLCTFLNAQNLDLQTLNGSSIDGSTYYIYDSGTNLAETHFQVSNSSSMSINFGVKIYNISNPTNAFLQVCFGSTCFDSSTGNQFTDGTANTPAGGSYSNLKVAPMSWGWVAGDSAVWRVTVYDVNNVNDSSSAIIVWKVAGVSVDEFSAKNVSMNVYPNPIVNNATFNYDIKNIANKKAALVIYDVLGNTVKQYSISQNNGKIILKASDFNRGIYFYSIKVNNVAIKTDRLVIQ